MVEIPLHGGKYQETLASLWISHLVDKLPRRPVMVAHIAAAELTNPRKIANDQCIIIFSLLSRLVRFNDFRWPILTFIRDRHTHTLTMILPQFPIHIRLSFSWPSSSIRHHFVNFDLSHLGSSSYVFGFITNPQPQYVAASEVNFLRNIGPDAMLLKMTDGVDMKNKKLTMWKCRIVSSWFVERLDLKLVRRICPDSRWWGIYMQ